ncbi:MAG: isoleucine--tRNA ligase, partial [Bradymonadaceae bacterium]
YVTLDEGTGCVHTAPGHGQEDFALGQEYGLDVVCPVGEDGTFTENFEVCVGEGETVELGGMHVLTANEHIAESLAHEGKLLNEAGERVEIERYPYGWRSGKPVIFRATEQWFVGLEGDQNGDTELEARSTQQTLREEMLAAIDEVDWVPEWGRDRIRGMVEGRPDWCISRQRTWGVPITAVYCADDDCSGVLADGELADYVADKVEEGGIDVWYEYDVDDLVPEGSNCPECGGESFEKESDILDVWFDSGVSWAAVLEERLGIDQPADLYLEGSDQHRGWFQSSLLTRVLTRDGSPYENCVTHGFVTDEEGHKYSKSSQNFEPPQQMLDDYGADILRLWVASVDYTGDVALSDEILEQRADAYRKVRNTFRFLLGNLGDFHPDDAADYDELHSIDRWVLHRASEVLEEVEEAYENYEFHDVYQGLVQFATVELSNVYMDATKDRLYCRAADDPGRRAAQTAYWQILSALARAAAPILSFTAEEVWSYLPGSEEEAESVFLADFPDVPETWRDDELGTDWEKLLDVRHEVERALEEQRQSDEEGTVDSDAEAVVTLTASGDAYDLLTAQEDESGLFELFGVSRVELEENLAGDALVDVEVQPAEADKCPRCWNYWVEPERDDEVCERCRRVLDAS